MDDETRDSTHDEPGSPAEPTARPAIGKDEWVARQGERRPERAGALGKMEARLRTAPWWVWLALFAGVVAMFPVGVESGYWRRVAFDTALIALLALGLNVVVGWGGLLDLGYVAFFGIGAYAYAYLSSDKYGVHLPTIATVFIVVAIGAIVGFLLGLPSRRLVGDYLAIVTLFFLQIFLTVTTNGDDVFGHNLTNGPNGLLHVDPFSFFGHELPVASSSGVFTVAYLYVALAVFVVVYIALRFVNHSRTGRAWRSLREDPLAAEVMGMPVNWLKLMSFSFGAAVAALTGTLFAAVNANVFNLSFNFPLLITVYTAVILGGGGSQAGVVLGAIIVWPLQERLREPGDSRVLFYSFVLLGLIVAFRRSMRLGAVLGGTLACGFIVHAVARAIDPTWVDGEASGPGHVADWASHWVVVPTHLASWITSVSYISLIACALTLTLLRGWARLALLVPVLYLAAFVWENVMLAKPEPTRFIVLGLLLVALMIVRPNGLLGEKRVEIL